MKDVVIRAQAIKRELLLLVLLLVAAIVMNVYAIVVHEGQWSELISQLHIVVLLALFFYVVVWIVRLIFWGIRALWMAFSGKKSPYSS